MNLFGKIFRTVRYQNKGREGYVHYFEGFKKVSFYMEFGGGDCVFYLSIPNDEKWESETQCPLYRKKEIVEYVAMKTQKDECSSCTFTIEESAIVFKTKAIKKD